MDTHLFVMWLNLSLMQSPYWVSVGLKKTMEENTSYVPKPDSHLGLAIFTTLCCCLPLGIVAILKANKVGDYYTMKQYEAANQASNDAKKWCIYGIASSFIIDAIWLIICLVSGASFFAFLPFLSGM